MIKIKLDGRFDSMYKELISHDPETKKIVDQAVAWFRNNSEDTRLDNHSF